MTPSQWLNSVHNECRLLILDLGTTGTTSFVELRNLLDTKVEVTEATWQVKNLIASLAVTDPAVLRGRIALVNAAIERLTKTREYIRQELNNDNRNQTVSRTPA